MMTTTYLIREMSKDWVPLPKPSSEPEQVMEIADMMNPRLIICRAVVPEWIVPALSVNIPINCSGMSQDNMVPSSMIPIFIASAVWWIFLTRPYYLDPKLYPMRGLMPWMIPLAVR